MNKIDIKFNNNKPVYQQIIKYFKIQIHLKKLKNKDSIPSRRLFATINNINPATVQKAYKIMEKENLIITIQNSKSIVSIDEDKLKRIEKELIEDEVKNFLKTVKEINLSFKDVIALLSNLWDER